MSNKFSPKTMTYEMRTHLLILQTVSEKYSDTEVYRLNGTRSNMLVLDYKGKRVCGLVSDKKGVPYGTLGTRNPGEREAKNALEVRGGYASDPEPDTLMRRYRFRPNWGHPYTINFENFEAMEHEVERLLLLNMESEK